MTAHANAKIDGIKPSSFSTKETVTPYKDITNYNNYYEFSTDKYEPTACRKISRRARGPSRSRPGEETEAGH